MPIITGTDNTRPSLNGDISNISSLLLSSLDDEESFVVLERSTANESTINEQDTSQPVQSQSFQNNCSFPVFNNMSSSGMTLSRTSQQSQVVPVDPLGIPFDSNNISVSAEEIEKRLQELLHENLNLKENLYQTNLAMKQQLSTVRLLQDRASEVQKNHQAKFEETKTLILKLGSEKQELQETNSLLNAELKKLMDENKQLKETNSGFGSDTSKLQSENEVHKKQIAELKELVGTLTEGARRTSMQLVSENDELKKQVSSLQALNENGRKASFQPTPKEVELHELVDQLTRKLEVVERARRQQDFDIDKLQAQVGRLTQELNNTQRKLAHSENEVQMVQNKVKSENSLHFGEKFMKYDGLLNQLKASVEEEQNRFNSLSSWLTSTDPVGNSAQFEISELRRLLSEEQSQSVARKENLFAAISLIHEVLGDFQKLGEELERVKAAHAVKESHGLAYDEMQKKGFRERLDSLTAKLVEKEEALAVSERHLASLQEAVRLQNDEKKDSEERASLKEKIRVLTVAVGEKEAKLHNTTQELDVLKAEVLKLRAINETIGVLEEQAKIYQADFEAERTSRESLVAEKERLLEDLRHLQRRNQDLIEELNRVRHDFASRENASSTTNTIPRQQERTPSPPAPKPNHRQFRCPNTNCNQPFNTVDEVHEHVIACWNLQD